MKRTVKQVVVSGGVIVLLGLSVSAFAQWGNRSEKARGDARRGGGGPLKVADVNEDGVVSREEFEAHLNQVFVDLDTDQSGSIEQEEGRSAFLERRKARQQQGDGASGSQKPGGRQNRVGGQQGRGQDVQKGQGQGVRGGGRDAQPGMQRMMGAGLSEEAWEKMLERHDADKDGQLSSEECGDRGRILDLADMDEDGVVTKKEARTVHFARLDADGDGKVSPLEASGFAEVDADGDGFWSAEEMDAAAEARREKMKDRRGQRVGSRGGAGGFRAVGPGGPPEE